MNSSNSFSLLTMQRPTTIKILSYRLLDEPHVRRLTRYVVSFTVTLLSCTAPKPYSTTLHPPEDSTVSAFPLRMALVSRSEGPRDRLAESITKHW